jgi:hypothetical protein
MDTGPALSVKDIASQYELSVGSLGAKTLGVRISAVLGRSHTFFMSHENTSFVFA